MAALVLVAVIGPLIVGGDPRRGDLTAVLLPPSSEHWFGTDQNGADVFRRVIFAAQLDLLIAVVAVGLASVVAVPLGAMVGYKDSWISRLILRFCDFLQSFPVFILALTLVAIRGVGVLNVVIVVFVLNVPILLRLVNTEVAAVAQRAFVEAGRASGASDFRIITRYILPPTLGPAVAQASANVGWALLLTAGLGFLGAGIRPPTPEWGSMIGSGTAQLTTGQWWPSVFPGLALGVTVLVFAVTGDRLRVLLDVTRRYR